MNSTSIATNDAMTTTETPQLPHFANTQANALSPTFDYMAAAKVLLQPVVGNAHPHATLFGTLRPSAERSTSMNQLLRRKQSFLLRLPPTMRENAARVAQDEGISLNHFIGLALAEKLSRLEMSQPAQRQRPAMPAHNSLGMGQMRRAS